MAEDERHIGDEIDETIDNVNDAASDIRDAVNNINNFKHGNKGEENSSDSKNDPSQSEFSSDRKGAESTSTSDGGTSSGGKNAGDNTFFSGGGKGAGADAAEGAASEIRQAGEDSSTEAAKKIVEESSKDVVSEFGATSAGGVLGGAHGAMIGFAIDLLRKFLKYIISGFIILLLIITIIICILPLLLFRLFVTEICIQITQATCEIYDNIFGIEGWDEASDETKRKFAEGVVNEFFGDVEETVDNIWGNITSGAYTFFQWCDDITDDDTWYGSFFDSAANWNYNQSVQLDIKKMKKDMEEGGHTYDGNAIMCYLVIEQLRACYADVDGYVSIEDMKQAVQDKKNELLNTYTTVNTEKYSGDPEAAKAWMFFFDDTSNPFIQGYIPVTNIPIVITGEENFVTNNGEYVGEIIEDKQYLRDNIMYNPYGNKRSTLSLSTGSDYEMMSHAAYIIAVYSVCTPYNKQSIADLLTDINDGMHQAKKEAKIDMVDYDAKFTEVYYGAIVPRVYQPYIYQAHDTPFSTKYVPAENFFKPGTYQNGFFETHTGARAIIGMGPADYSGYHIYNPTGWFDVNGDLIAQNDEMLPMVLQQLDIPSDGQNSYYPDSFCVVTSDKFYCNINADTGLTRVQDSSNDDQGYYIYGANTKEYETLPYSHTDWTAELNSQIKQQDNLITNLDEAVKAQYVYRFQFPFTRISTGWNDDGVSQVTRVTPIVVNNATDASGDYPELYRMGWVSGNYRNGEYIYQTYSNGGIFNGYQAWVYLDPEVQKKVSLTEGEQHETVTDFNVFALDNWVTDTVGVPSDPGKSYEEFINKPYLYNAKIRYMISINVTAIPHYFDFVTECFDYKPNSPVYRGLSYKNYYRPEPEYVMDAKGYVKQGDLATGSLKMYMELLGMSEEVVLANNPQIGTEPTYSYEDMMKIVKQVRNADGTEASPNQKYLVYTGICALGHVMYQWAGDSGPGLDFQKWMTSIPNAKKDPKNMLPYEYFGLDCSGFISWIYKSTFFPDMSRFDSSSVITIYGDEKTTLAVRQGKSTAASNWGEVFWDPTKLQVGDIAVRRKLEDGKLSGHVVMYCGQSPNDSTKQLWIEMTRFETTSSEYGQVNGARLFEMYDYGATRSAVYISTHNLIPKEDVEWSVISPTYMMIPSRNEIMSTHYGSKLGPQGPTEPGEYDLSGMIIVLDPGHQAKADSSTEPIAPWSNDQKAKVSAGTKGVSTGRPEYEVVLEIALKMKAKLESMGATVILTRYTNDVNISNIERAQIATANNADVFIRLHCDDSSSPSARGIGVFVCSRGDLADKQVTWGNWLGECMSDATGSRFRGTNASTTYSGLNWSTSVPSFLLEMGFMSNREDDKLLSDPDYQDKICNGAAAFCYKMKQGR